MFVNQEKMKYTVDARLLIPDNYLSYKLNPNLKFHIHWAPLGHRIVAQVPRRMSAMQCYKSRARRYLYRVVVVVVYSILLRVLCGDHVVMMMQPNTHRIIVAEKNKPLRNRHQPPQTLVIIIIIIISSTVHTKALCILHENYVQRHDALLMFIT